jgi:4-amino-4-deoxy-L-arabinose transferase-like glycosyltransferase
VIGFGLRLPGFHQSLFGDEFYAHMDLAGTSDPIQLLHRLHDSIEVSPPLYFMLAWLSHLASSTPEALRIPSLIAGTLLIPSMFLLGRRVAGERVGLVAAILSALAPFAIYYSTEARPYALVALLCTLNLIALLRVVELPSLGRLAVLTISCDACIYTHYTAIFVVASALAWAFLAYPGLRRQVAASAIAAAVLYLPWLGFVSGKDSLYLYGHVHGRGLIWLLTSLGRTSIGAPYIPLRTVPGPAAIAIASACVAAGLLAQRSRRAGPQSPIILIAATCIATVTGLSAYAAMTNVNLLGARNLSASLSGLIVLIAVAVAGPRQRLVALALSLVTTGVFAFSAWQSMLPEHARPDVAAAARTLNRVVPADTIVVTTGLNKATIYLKHKHLLLHISARDNAWRIAKLEHRPLAFLAMDWVPANTSIVPALAGRFGFREVCRRSFGGFFPVRVVLFMPPGSTGPPESACPAQLPVETTPPADRRDTIILAWANGGMLLPQHEPLDLSDLIGPIIGLVLLRTGGAWIVRRRPSTVP